MEDTLDSTLDFNHLKAFTAFARGRSVAILGGAGSGKSFLLSRILQEARKKHGASSVIACACTNQVTLSVNGVTMHSLFGVHAAFHFEENSLWNRTKRNEKLVSQLMNAKVIVIDEESALKAHVLDAIDFVMSHTSGTEGSACLPMGSRQLVVAGDPFQLEPIGVDHCSDELGPVYSAKSWESIFGSLRSGVIALLKGNHRQKQDAVFYEILNRMRIGCCTEADIAAINTTGFRSRNIPMTHTAICLRRYQVQELNKIALSNITGPTFTS